MSSWAALVKSNVAKMGDDMMASTRPAKIREEATKAMQESTLKSKKKSSVWSTKIGSSEKPNFSKIMLDTKTTGVEMRKNLVTFPQLGQWVMRFILFND